MEDIKQASSSFNGHVTLSRQRQCAFADECRCSSMPSKLSGIRESRCVEYRLFNTLLIGDIEST